ncbi:MAG TPA: hypothetical protein VNG35_10245 [Gemmatimonadales bacterium]|nr:hypothetical protein [Gemmatimonadales bacterium]
MSHRRAWRCTIVTLLALGCGDSSSPPSLVRVAILTHAALTTFMVNDTTQLQLAGYDASGQPFPTGPVQWRSSSPTVVQIDTNGTIVGLMVGAATIVATAASHSDSLVVTVGGTRHRYPITANETWTLAGNPHLVVAQLPVGGPGGATLTIEPGTIVRFTDTAGLVFGVNGPGALLALGSGGGGGAALITFTDTSATPMAGGWIGLTFLGNNRSELHAVELSGCGHARSDDQPAGCLVVGHRFPGPDPTILLDGVYVVQGKGGGVVLQDKARFDPASYGLSVTSMRGYIASLPAGAVADFPPGGSFLGNDTDEVRVTGDTLRESATWQTYFAWTVVGPVLIEGPAQPVLTILPGQILRFGFGAGFVVGKNAPGGLVIGSPSTDPEILEDLHGSTWAGVDFYAASLPSSINNAALKNCGNYNNVLYGQACIAIVGNFADSAPAPVLQNVTIQGAVDVGVLAVGGGRFGAGSHDLTITGTAGTIGSPLWFHLSSPSSLPVGTYTGNAQDVIRVYDVDITANETWHNPGVPYFLSTGIVVGNAADPTLTLDSGVVVQFQPGGILSIGELAAGAVRALGTATSPVTLAGQHVDPGAWMGVTIGTFADSTTVFDHVVVQDAGADDGILATSFRIARDYGPIVLNTLITGSAGCGITRMTGATWTTDFTAPALGNTFQNNLGPAQCGP